MESNIPEAMTGEYPLSLEELVSLIKKQKELFQNQHKTVKEKELAIKNVYVTLTEWEDIRKKNPCMAGSFSLTLTHRLNVY